MKRTRVMFPVVSEKFGLVFFFFLGDCFLFTIMVDWSKVKFSKKRGELQLSPPPRLSANLRHEFINANNINVTFHKPFS